MGKGRRRIRTGFPLYGREDDGLTLPACARTGPRRHLLARLLAPCRHTAAYVIGSLPATASARPSFTRRRTWASASETAMLREP